MCTTGLHLLHLVLLTVLELGVLKLGHAEEVVVVLVGGRLGLLLVSAEVCAVVIALTCLRPVLPVAELHVVVLVRAV